MSTHSKVIAQTDTDRYTHRHDEKITSTTYTVMCGYTPLTIRETETLTSNGLYI